VKYAFAGQLVTAAGLVLTLAGAAGATTYRCSPQGSDNNDGVRGPWRTVQRAANTVRPGDRVVLADGNYTGGVVHKTSGQQGAPITYVAEHPGRAVIRGGVIGFLIDNADWVTLDGLTVREANSRGVRAVVSHHLTVRNCTLADNGIEGIITGFCNDVLIENNESYGNGRGYAEYLAHKGHGIYVSCSGDRPVIRNNRCHDNGGCGIQLNANPRELGTNRGIRCDGVISNALVQDNVLYRNGRGPDGGGAGINMQSVRNSLVYNNLLYHNYAGGIACFADYAGPSWGCRNNRFINNTIYFKPNEGRYGVQFVEGSRGNVLRNNIIVTGRGPAIEVDGASGEPDSDYNLLYAAKNPQQLVARSGGASGYAFLAWQGRGHDRNSRTLAADRLFTDPNAAKPDFRIAANSPAASAGVAVAGVNAPPAGVVGLRAARVNVGWTPRDQPAPVEPESVEPTAPEVPAAPAPEPVAPPANLPAAPAPASGNAPAPGGRTYYYHVQPRD
jgi:hypothetical protein